MDLRVVDQSNDQAIYQATKEIFVGQKAKFRKLGPVQKCIRNYSKKNALVRQCLTQHGDESIHQTVLRLLSDRVYESTLIAANRFPDLFKPSAAQTAARGMLEAQATSSEEAALESFIQTEWSGGQGVIDPVGVAMSPNDIEDTVIGIQANYSSLFPVYLPFPKDIYLWKDYKRFSNLLVT
ncbi:unnamed protein product, partial [Clonostachys rosea f. rosea IK726]